MLRLNRRAALLAGGTFGVATMLGGCSARIRPLLAADSQPDGYPTVEALRYFAQDLFRRTEGQLDVEVYPSEQLGSQSDTLELAQLGGIDFLRINTAPLNVLVPETLVPSLPFIFRSTRHMRSAMDGAPGREILDSLARHGLIGLAFYDSGARSIYTVNRAVREPRDMAGLKIRVQTSDVFVSMIEAMGGNATPMAYGEVYQGLVQGVIDGAENNLPSYESSRHYEVAPVYSLTRHVMAPEILAMSRKSWEKLSPEHREAVRAAAAASVPFMRDMWDERVVRSRAIVSAAGMQIVDDVDREAFSKRMEPVWANYAGTPALRKLVEDIRSIGVEND
ncbi:TRAP transporter substrate-binding protein [Altericroceibacterium endophyticum]|uniref:DctP family TRAP transporter solute-binding subunit n=1 Tax=Altericroceibacterium endophyticum TaxID=1808508 RepID=A0A6I4T094_9SPHN|nr:TRAP transporter substrate-binding protein [Altericroceibacterium endophyticum]MXO64504.1 DctP family TRAP transporter solute-binding subunit [Altericroceibacterium endophyticum]